MTHANEQQKLTAGQIEAFHHDVFVTDQVEDFNQLFPGPLPRGVVVDVGGGCGYFARALESTKGLRTRVIDMDHTSVALSQAAGLSAELGDALEPRIAGDEAVTCFNLILHHLVGESDSTTRRLQTRALRVWLGKANALFVNEYIYESFIGNLSGRLIYLITASRLLSAIGHAASRLLPSLRANTFGVGVRFRAHEEWRKLFMQAGYAVVETRIGKPEPIALPLRLLLIRAIRRDSFRLAPAAPIARSPA